MIIKEDKFKYWYFSKKLKRNPDLYNYYKIMSNKLDNENSYQIFISRNYRCFKLNPQDSGEGVFHDFIKVENEITLDDILKDWQEETIKLISEIPKLVAIEELQKD